MCRNLVLVSVFLFTLALLQNHSVSQAQDKAGPMITANVQTDVAAKMIAEFGEPARPRIESGTARVASLWRKEDGSAQDYEKYCMEQFVADTAALDRTFERLQTNFEALWGHMHQISRKFNEPLDLDLGAPLPIDYIFAKYSSQAHIDEDFFNNKIAFVIALNFPYYSDRKLTLGKSWDRSSGPMRGWVIFSARVPALTRQKMAEIYVRPTTTSPSTTSSSAIC
jgi:hypothetical protein